MRWQRNMFQMKGQDKHTRIKGGREGNLLEKEFRIMICKDDQRTKEENECTEQKVKMFV